MCELFPKHVWVIRALFDWTHMIVPVIPRCSTFVSAIYTMWNLYHVDIYSLDNGTIGTPSLGLTASRACSPPHTPLKHTVIQQVSRKTRGTIISTIPPSHGPSDRELTTLLSCSLIHWTAPPLIPSLLMRMTCMVLILMLNPSA